MSATYQVNAAGTTGGESQTVQQQNEPQTVTLNPAEMLLKKGATTDIILAGFRWVGVAIPAKAKILKVKLELWVPSSAGTTNNKPGGAEVLLLKEPAGCKVFEAKTNNLGERPHFKAVVPKWESAVTAGAWNSFEDANLTKHLEELVALEGWASGNAVGIQITALAETHLQIENYVGTHEHGAKLTIEYEGEGGGASPHPITATFVGASSFTAKPNAPLKLSGIFAGIGAVTDKPNTPRKVTGTFPGVGTLAAAVNTPRRLSAAFSGTGALSAIINTPRRILGAFTGQGTLAARITTPRQLVATFPGVGTLAARLTAARKVRGVFAGVGDFLGSLAPVVSVASQRTPTRVTVEGGLARVVVVTVPTQAVVSGAASRIAVTSQQPSRLAVEPQPTKVVMS